jgi:amino acid adenylation domain-containing protein
MSALEDVRLAALTDAQRALLQKRLRGEAVHKPRPTIPPRSDASPVPLTSSQRGVWTAENLYPGKSVWNLTDAFWLEGDLDAKRFEDALAHCFHRHDVFRIGVRPGVPPTMVVEENVPLPFRLVDLSTEARPAARAEANRLAAEEAAGGFEIGRPSLLSVVLIRIAPDEHLLIFKLHHLVGDGWSFGVVVAEVQEAYTALTEGRAPQFPDLPVQFLDYAAAEHLRQDERDRQVLEALVSELADAPRLSTLPPSGRRPAVFAVDGGCHRFRIPRPSVVAAEQLARRLGTTPFVVMLTAFLATLTRLSNQDDVLVGTPTANRRFPEVEPLVGMFVNTVVQRLRSADGMTFGDALAQVGAGVLASLQRQHVPFEDVLTALNLPRDVSLHPLFQVMFVFQNWPFPTLQLPGVVIRRADVHPAASKYDLTVVLEERDGELEGYVEYATRLYSEAAIARFAASFCRLLAEGCGDPSRKLKNLLAPTEAERAHILSAWDATAEAAPFVPIRERIEQIARHHGEALAVRFGPEGLTYAQLDAYADATAINLRQRGWKAGDRVGLLLARSLSLPVALLACLKAGLIYVPLDARHPPERLRAILNDAGADRILTNEGAAEIASALSEDVAICALEADGPRPAEPWCDPSSEDLAYIIYTSGSTGVPKAVPVTQGNFSVAVGSLLATPGLTADDHVLATATLAFDAHVMDLIAPLTVGASVRVAEDRDAADPHRLAELIADDGLTVIQATPSTWRLLQQAGWGGSTSLRAFVGAEPLGADLATWLRARCREVWHLYGVTECSVWQAGGLLQAEEPTTGAPPIAAPLPGFRVLLLDDELRPLAPGLVGEIHIGGPGVVSGYLGNTALTDQAFVPDPYGRPKDRLYKSGDLGRLRPDGKLEILGRRDHQVKVRGSRVELAEVEAGLLQVEGVRAACVLMTDAGLAAYIVADELAALTRRSLRQALGRHLPDYMLPDTFALIAAMPVNPNGKIDRRRLATLGRRLGDGPRLGPEDASEARVAAIWSEVLGSTDFGVTDGFFDVGGTSLSAFALLTRLRAEGCPNLDLIDVFEFPTIRDMAKRMRQGEGAVPIEMLAAITSRSEARRGRGRTSRGRSL